MTTTAECVHRLEDWFNKNLKSEQFEMFVNRIRFIPSRAMADIVERIIEDSPPTPGRFPTPAKIKDGWHVWRQEHPEAISTQKRTNCRECDSTGYLWGTKIDDECGRKYSQIFRCPYCENWRFDFNDLTPVPMRSREQLKSRGYDVLDWGPPQKDYRPPKGGTTTIAKEMIHDIPDGKEHYRKVKRQAKDILNDHDNHQ